MIEEKSFGTHRMLLEEDGFLTVEVHGELSASEANGMMAEHDKNLLEYGTLFLLCDVRQFTQLGPGGRQALLQRQTEIPPYYIAIVSDKFVTRIVSDMLYRAVKLLDTIRITVRNFDNPKDAREWLLEQQSIWKATNSSSKT